MTVTDDDGSREDPLGNDGLDPMPERIADAAISLIARHGFDALSVRRVATKASIAAGTVQHHYPTKVDLTVAALDRTVRRQIARMAALPRGTGPVIERFVDQLCTMLATDGPSTEEAVVWIAMSAAVPGHPFVAERQREAAREARRWMAGRLRRAQQAGELRPDIDADDVAVMIEAALDGLMLQTVADAELADDARRRLDTMVARLLAP
jgi:AcrR family transcriptional regulator